MTRYQFAAALFALGATLPAWALTVAPLPGATPQHAAIGQPFPNAIGVAVRDDSGQPIPGAAVRWGVPAFDSGLSLDPATPGCRFDVGTKWCDRTTDANGISTLSGIVGNRATHEFVSVSATVGTAFATTRIELTVDPLITPVSVAAVRGAAQRVPIGTTLPEAFAVRVTRPDGSPVQGAPVAFSVIYDYAGPKGTFAPQASQGNPNAWYATTDGNGNASAGAFTVEWGMGRGIVVAGVWDAEARATVTVPFEFFVTNPSGGDTLSFQDMWWGGPEQAGWGVSVAQHGDKLFPILFAYDSTGKPTWRVLSDGMWMGGVGAHFLGPMHGPRGAPWFEYDASRFTPGPNGSMTLSFQGEERASIRIGLPNFAGTVEKPLERFDFSRDDLTPLHGVGDMWWGGPEQSGWGVSIMEKPGGLFSVWFTYDEKGDATWFVMPDGRWTSSDTYEGRMYRTTSSPWFGGAYDASQFRATEVGPCRLRFTGKNAARLEYNVDGRSGTLDLVRFSFD